MGFIYFLFFFDSYFYIPSIVMLLLLKVYSGFMRRRQDKDVT